MMIKTKFGKFISVVLVVSCILFLIGFGCTLFELIINIRDLDVNTYQSIIDLGDICLRYACMFSFTIITPGLVLNDNKKLNEKANKSKHSFFKTIFVISTVIYMINLFYDIGFVVGQLMAG